MIKKLQYAVWKKETNNAGGKAKNDAFDIAEKMGFQASYVPSDKRYLRIIQQYLSMHKFDAADVVFMQYPAVDFRIMPSFLRHLAPTKKSIALIHDLRSIQGAGTEEDISEIPVLNNFMYVIAHNKYMAEYLANNGYSGHIITLDLFDYLHDKKKSIQAVKGDRSIVFAGNLVKSRFLKQLDRVEKISFILYGNGGEEYSQIKNIDYKGSLPSDVVVYRLEGDYGLVWDGDTAETCAGKNGEYLRYNNPHKLSLYIAAGKPVVTWSHAAIADFIRENRIGILVDSLLDLNNIDLSVGYDEMRANVLKIKDKVAEGYFLKCALQKCLL